MDDIYLLMEGKEEGPFTGDEVLQALDCRLIPGYLPAWHEGLADWVPVDKLIGLHLSLQFASPDEVSQALRSETITGTQLVDRRTKVLSLSYACPHNCGKPRDCPFSEIRKKNNYEKCQWIESLSQACLRDLITFHQKCLAKKMKLKPQPRLMEGAKSKC